jgi:hypothetical protein
MRKKIAVLTLAGLVTILGSGIAQADPDNPNSHGGSIRSDAPPEASPGSVHRDDSATTHGQGHTTGPGDNAGHETGPGSGQGRNP